MQVLSFEKNFAALTKKCFEGCSKTANHLKRKKKDYFQGVNSTLQMFIKRKKEGGAKKDRTDVGISLSSYSRPYPIYWGPSLPVNVQQDQVI